ncbi:MAG: phosphatase PAP2-related protein [bacterium]|nr:phosphatase PAP2-related protein [bacterium]
MDSSRTTPLHHHKSPHRELLRRYRHYGAQQEFRVSVLLSVLTFIASLITVFYAIGYATESASNAVTDIILSNTPVYDVGGLFVYGTIFFVLAGTAFIAAHPKRIPFALHTIALFYFTRAAFISLTHLGPFPLDTANSFDFGTILSRFFFGGDLFFSGHTGLAFLLALMFWYEKKARYFFLAASVYFGAIVLLGHLHYSIDVASAFFITYGIFHIAAWLFPKDRAVFLADEGGEA